jgi:DNA (cytosine-5)-methyltransferase 1
LFSGIEAASVAWGPLGWKCAAVAEIEPFPCAALKEHYPKVPNLGDVTKITREMIRALGKLDIVIFGSPCQDLSVAGKREGIGGARSGLFFTAIEIIQWAREECGARFALWENVPGAFSSSSGGDFAEVVGAMAGCRIDVPEHGWGTEGAAVGANGLVEWSVLDAQWFGVAQRRRRVFALLDTGDWAGRPPILLEPQGLRGDSAPSREAGQSTAGTLASRTSGGGFPGTDEACEGHVTPCLTASRLQRIGESTGQDPVVACFGGGNRSEIDVAATTTTTAAATAKAQRLDFESETFVAFHHNAQAAQLPTTDTSKTAALTCSQGAAVATCATGDVFHTLRAEGFDASEDGTGRGGAIAVALRGREGGAACELGDEVGFTLRASSGGGDKPHVLVPDTLYIKGIEGATHASSSKTDPRAALRVLQEALGEKAFAEWVLGILDSLQPPEILRQALHGLRIRPAEFSRCWVVRCASSLPEDRAAWCVQSLREAGRSGRTPQRRKSLEQHAGELGAYLSELPQQNSPADSFLQSLREVAEGSRILREALSKIQEVRRPTTVEGESTYPGAQVRRLTPICCERLQGFPDRYTQIPWRGKPAELCPDGPRYKALGNSMHTGTIRWIGQAIERALKTSTKGKAK